MADRMRRRLRTKRGRAIYAQRKFTVEPVIGQVTGCGFRRFSLRGVEDVKGELQLVCAVHDLVKLWRTGADAVRRMPLPLSVRFTMISPTPSST